MIKNVSLESTTWNELPWKFEAGTPDACGAIALGGAVDPHSGEELTGAIDYLNAVGMSTIHKHERELCEYAISQLSLFDNTVIYGPKTCKNKCGIISFNITRNNEMIDSHIVTNLLDEEGIAVRSGGHCAYPLMQYLKIDGAVRLSFYLYNTFDEIDKFIKSLRLIIEKKLV
jgi:cysteine desulfurase/selenocysteine lyase